MAGVSYDDLTKDLRWYSEAVSKGVRTTAFGTIAAIWAVFTADGIVLLPTALFGLPTSLLVKLAFIFASVTLLADVLQYIAALWMTNIGMDRLDKREEPGDTVELYYDRDNLGRLGITLYWLNFVLLPVKLILALAAGTSFVFFAFAVTM